MTQVSRIPLRKDIELQMHAVFRAVITGLREEQDVTEFLDDLLTPTEKIMLGKRLAIAVLIEKGYDHRSIRSTLHVSSGTVSQVHYWLKNKGVGYRKVIGRILSKEQWIKRLDVLQKIAHEMATVGYGEVRYDKPKYKGYDPVI